MERWTGSKLGKEYVKAVYCHPAYLTSLQSTVVLERTLESPLDCKEIQPAHPKGGQSWIFIGRTDAEAEAPVFWPPDVKNWLIRKDSDAGKDWRQEKGMTEDEMFGWHHWLDEHEFEQAPEIRNEQGDLLCCSPWGQKQSDTTEQLNSTEPKHGKVSCTIGLKELIFLLRPHYQRNLKI